MNEQIRECQNCEVPLHPWELRICNACADREHDDQRQFERDHAAGRM